MKRLEVEIWALEVIDNVQRKLRVEDDRVEVKRDWPDHAKAARRIAGHANAMRGEDILWIIGLDEKQGAVTGCDSSTDPATWWAQTSRHFDGDPPSLSIQFLPGGDNQVAALHFDTSRYPFVIKDSSGKQLFDREVPWREGTSVRSAHRSELLRLLHQRDHEPRFDVIDSAVRARKADDHLSWTVKVEFYGRVSSMAPLSLAFHETEVVVEIPDIPGGLIFTDTRLSPPTLTHWGTGGPSSSVDSLTVSGTRSELFLEGPGRFFLYASLETDLLSNVQMVGPVDLKVVLKDVLTGVAYQTLSTLSQASSKEGSLRWTLLEGSHMSEG